MQFRTEIFPPKGNPDINHNSKLVFYGSCFTEHIGIKFNRYRFNTTINSHGIVFNPESLAIALNDCLDKRIYLESDLVLHNGVYCSFNHHGKFNRAVSPDILDLINRDIDVAYNALISADVLFVTLGSAYAYVDKESDEVVANCHKIPQVRFTKILLDHHRIEAVLSDVFLKLRSVNPGIKIVLTVSPVRHLKDGLIENQLSKSHLLIACHNLVDSIDNAYYFPSYELVIDDLRDYRFFEPDMLHPNSTAIEYVWNKLKDWCISAQSRSLMDKLDPLISMAEHRVLSRENEALHRARIEDNEQRIRDMIGSMPKKG